MVNINDFSIHGSPSAPRKVRRRPLLAIAAVGLLSLAACGSSDSSSADGVASVNDVSSDVSSDGSTPDAEAGGNDSEVVFAEYQKCMEDEGVDMSVLMGEAGGGGNEIGDGGEAEITIPDDFDWEAMEAASEVCDPILEDFDPLADMSPDEKAAIEDYTVELQKCMSEKGFDDVVTGPGGGNEVGDEDVTDFTMDPNTDFEAMEAAFEECDEQVEVPQVLQDLEESLTSEP